MPNKKSIRSVTYKKGTEMTNPEEIKSVVDRSSSVEVKNQTVYDDGSQSLTVKIHFKP